MKTRLTTLALLTLTSLTALAFAADTQPADTQPAEVTLTGTLTCAQCELKEKVSKSHLDVLIVTEGDSEVKYYIADLPKHPNVCHTRIKNVKVTGTVSEKDGKKWIASTKLRLPYKE